MPIVYTKAQPGDHRFCSRNSLVHDHAVAPAHSSSHRRKPSLTMILYPQNLSQHLFPHVVLSLRLLFRRIPPGAYLHCLNRRSVMQVPSDELNSLSTLCSVQLLPLIDVRALVASLLEVVQAPSFAGTPLKGREFLYYLNLDIVKQVSAMRCRHQKALGYTLFSSTFASLLLSKHLLFLRSQRLIAE